MLEVYAVETFVLFRAINLVLRIGSHSDDHTHSNTKRSLLHLQTHTHTHVVPLLHLHELIEINQQYA